MDLEQLAKQFDESMVAAIEQLNDVVESEICDAARINPDVAKTSREWSQLLGKPHSRTYNSLRDLVSEGVFERVVAKDPQSTGRALHFYYPASENPFLPDDSA